MASFLILVGTSVSVSTLIHYRKVRSNGKTALSNLLWVVGIALFLVAVGILDLLR